VRASSWLAIGGLGATVACGHGGDHGVTLSGTDLSCGSHTYIANGECLDLPAFSDASLVPDAGDASPDAGDAPDDSDASSVDSPSDAGVDEPAAVDPLAPCASTSNVFFVEADYLLNGPTLRATYTNIDATFAAAVPSLRITVTPTSDSPTLLTMMVFDDGGALAVPNPGTYQTGTPGIFLNLTLSAIDTTFDKGAVTIEDVQVDPGDDGGGPARLHSLLLAYDLFNSTGQTARGCLRYIE
jgi:hypothetical protein